MAERKRFELLDRLSTISGFQSQRLQPDSATSPYSNYNTNRGKSQVKNLPLIQYRISRNLQLYLRRTTVQYGQNMDHSIKTDKIVDYILP